MAYSLDPHRFSTADRLVVAAHVATAVATVLFTLSAILRAVEQGGRIPDGPITNGTWPTHHPPSQDPPSRAQSYFT